MQLQSAKEEGIAQIVQIKWQNEPTIVKIGHCIITWFKFNESSQNFEQLFKIIWMTINNRKTAKFIA